MSTITFSADAPAGLSVVGASDVGWLVVGLVVVGCKEESEVSSHSTVSAAQKNRKLRMENVFFARQENEEFIGWALR